MATEQRSADDRITVWGDFTCPWSHLAWRRTELLADDGVEIDWRTVEHEPWRHVGPADVIARHRSLHDEVQQVLGHLLPGEPFPYAPPTHVPFTGAATSAYAEAYAAGVDRPVRRTLFRSFWEDGTDLGDARILRELVADELLGSSSTSEPVWRWGLAVDVTGGPVSGAAWHLVRDWRSQWREVGGTVPTVLVGGRRIVGVEAVDWLGAQVRDRGLAAWDDPQREHSAA
ncbi:DsbA family protein [Intrasporangium sp.]|uniref:DsbA family oxidoreductase n=1 Tax=Intrasporangium sp. TaxID=1925024 RepID=UPI002939F905|nr:DsbA family protein [Intrasporangium sp.]MDV3222941.1 DsbA family protein [Intrasporangium sp.]